MDFDILLQQEMEKLIKDQAIQGIVLIGSAVDKTNFKELNDLDLFVITKTNTDFAREVFDKGGIKFDLSYISLDLLKKGIKERWLFLINSFFKYKIIYTRNKEIEELLAIITQICQAGPKALSAEEIQYLRFKLYQDFQDIINRKDDKLNSIFLVHNLFKEILTAYFQLNNFWLPKEKKMLTVIAEKDKQLYTLSKNFLEELTIERKIEKLWTTLAYVLEPFEGFLAKWPKGKFPIK